MKTLIGSFMLLSNLCIAQMSYREAIIAEWDKPEHTYTLAELMNGVTYDTVKVLVLICDTSGDNKIEYTTGYDVKVKSLRIQNGEPGTKITTIVWSYGYLVVLKQEDRGIVIADTHGQYPKFGFHSKNLCYLNGNKKKFKPGTVIFQSLYLSE